MLNILYLPLQKNNPNKYCENMEDILSDFGSVSDFTVKKGLRNLVAGNRTKADIIFLNWIENEIVTKSGSLSVYRFAKSVVKLNLCKLFARKLVYVRHNRFPHNTCVKHKKVAARAADFLESFCDASVVHSMPETRGSRMYVPHPLYKVEASTDTADDPLPGYFVCFGRIMRYKHFETLVEHFPRNRRLLIIGTCDDPEYVKELNALSAGNVVIRDEYFTEQDAQHLILGSEGVIICHAEENVIVSGTFFYAVSLGVRVLAIETGFLNWARQELGDDLVMLHSSIPDLARSLPTTPRPKAEAATDPRVQGLFGDRIIKEALSNVFEKVGVR
jgi:glycosyltransferase involved in cell wall biosynthesis